MDNYQILIRPMVTEKGTHQAQTLHAYPFVVHSKANKIEIRHAVEKIYSVRVTDVRTSNRKGKPRRRGGQLGHTGRWKKAIVVLHEDDHIDLF